MKFKKLGIIATSILSIVSIIGLTLDKQVKAYDTLTEDQKLYYGYNVTSGKSLMEQDSLQTTFPIIDSTKTYNGKTYNDYITKVVGSSTVAYDHSQSYSLKSINTQYSSSVGADVYGKIYAIDTDLATTFDTSTTMQNKYSEYYELVSAYIARYYYVVQNLDVEQIRNFISDSFKNELESISSIDEAKVVISRYGTHLNTGYTMGGRLNITNYQVSSSTTQDYSQVVSLTEKVSTAVGKVQAGESGSFASDYANSESTESNKSNYSYKSYGGAATSAFTLDGLFTYSASILDSEKSGFMYTKWVNSINNDQDLAIIGIPNGAQSIPLWNLLDNNSKTKKQRNYLQQAYKELCGDKYEEYQNKYKEISRNASDVENGTSGIVSTLNGLYVRNSNDYFYYVDKDTYKSNKFYVKEKQYLYLDLSEATDLENIEYSCSNCTLIDKKNAIFKVNDNVSTGKVVITATYGKDTTQKLFEATISSDNFEAGFGTEDYPYVITSVDQFKSISDMSAYYILYDDIDLNGAEINSFTNFSGVFNGNYYTIKNFTIKQNSTDNFGLFEQNSGTIKNLKLFYFGTSTNEDGFTKGGVTYRSNYVNEDYNTNSCNVKNAGLICGTNTGTIDNCYIENGYVRNVIKTTSGNSNYGSDSKYVITVGSVCGINKGTIKNTMVYNTRLLNSYYNTDAKTDDTNETVIVTTGGLVGKMESGTISSSVYSSGDSGTIMSQNVNLNYKGEYNCYAAGLIGYLTNSSSINGNYVYIRECENTNTTRVVDASVVKDTSNSNYKCLINGSIIVSKDYSNPSISNLYYTSKQAGDCFTGKVIQDNSTKGNNIKGDSSTYTLLDKASEKSSISSLNEISNMGLSTSYYQYEKDYHFKGIKHILENDRNKVITISQNQDDASIKTSFYQNEIFTLNGLSMSQIFNSSEEALVYYKVKVVDSDKNNIIDQKLSTLGTGHYDVLVYINDSIKLSNISLTINSNKITRLYIDTNDTANQIEIYSDQVEEFITNFSYDTIKLIGVYSNGEQISINQDGIGSKSNKISLKKPSSVSNYADYYKVGSNVAYVSYGNLSEVAFMINVIERDIESIEITQLPTTLEYACGKTVSLDGMSVTINYSEGDSKVLSTRSELNNLEVIGSIIGFGSNTVSLSYSDYSDNNMPTFTAYGLATITFTDEDGKVLSSTNYNEGETVVEPETPIKEQDSTYTYTFSNWDKDVSTVSGNIIYKACYSKSFRDYTIIFVNDDDKPLSSKSYHYGEVVVEPETPSKESDNTYTYTFAGWSPSISIVSSDQTYTATYSKEYINYTVTFLNDDETEIISTTYHYGETVVEPETPTKTSDNTYTYTFVSWDKEVSVVTGNTTYKAKYSKNYIEYTVKFVNEDGTPITSNTYHYGETVVEPETPSKESDNTYTYTFAGWDKEVSVVTGNTTYTATFTKVSIANELINTIKSLENNVDLSTYDSIKSIKDQMNSLTDSDKKLVNKELDVLIGLYQTYVNNINNEYEVANTIEDSYYIPSLVILSISSLITISGAIICRKWWL